MKKRELNIDKTIDHIQNNITNPQQKDDYFMPGSRYQFGKKYKI